MALFGEIQLRRVGNTMQKPSSFCRFHQALINYGVDEVDIFQTNDLSEKRDMGSVTNTMFALGRAVSEF